MSGWVGVRLQFNCGHYDLRDADLTPAPRVGQLYPCNMCPTTLHSRTTPGVAATATRFIVEIVPVTAVQPPDPWGPEHWYGA